MRLKGIPLLDLCKGLAQLIRLPDVLIIVLTQVLLRYCIVVPFLYSDAPDSISTLPDFLLLVFITILIAVGGYIINDYFDVKIDSINRPGKLVVNNLISGRTAISLHLILNGIAILLGFYLAWRVKTISLGLIFPFLSGLLWIYSAKYKRVLFWGNFIVSGLSAFVILIVWLFEFFWLRLNPEQFAFVLPNLRWATNIFLAYATFAFLVSIMREIIKDMEDVEGDSMVGCSTLPLVTGIRNTRLIVIAILVVTIILLGYGQLVLYQRGLHVVFWYFLVFVQCLAFFMLAHLFKAENKRDFHYLSNLCKLIMITGIFSMPVILLCN